MQIKERLTAENCCPVSLLYVVSKAFEKLVNNRIVDVLEKYVLFPYFQYVFRSSWSTGGLLTVVSDRTTRALTGLGLLELLYFIYSRLLTGFSILVFFINLSLMKFQVTCLAFFCLFSVKDGFGWFWMGSLYNNIQLMLEFFKDPLLVLHFSCHTLMTFLMMLCVILLSMLMILPFILSVIRHLIYSNN